jgi:hypothetical protein
MSQFVRDWQVRYAKSTWKYVLRIYLSFIHFWTYEYKTNMLF